MEKSRTKNTIRNIQSGIIVQVINKVMAYLGINGLFTNILVVLSFAELGIGTAIIFSMYKPIANGDKEKI